MAVVLESMQTALCTLAMPRPGLVDEGSLGVHQIKLMIESSPGLGDGGGVGEHADSSLYLGQVSSGDDSGRLVVDANLEASGTPVNKLDGPLALDGGDGS